MGFFVYCECTYVARDGPELGKASCSVVCAPGHIIVILLGADFYVGVGHVKISARLGKFIILDFCLVGIGHGIGIGSVKFFANSETERTTAKKSCLNMVKQSHNITSSLLFKQMKRCQIFSVCRF